jgi:hypothetical protein
MCPACIGNAAWIVAGALSAGGASGWTAFVLRRPRERSRLGQDPGPGSSPQARSSNERSSDDQEPRTIKENPS